MPKVLISDKMSPLAAEIFKKRGVEVDVITDQTPEELMKIIGEYDGLAIRSSTTVTKEILEKAKKLKVIGRAGIGTDNIDKAAASEAGVVVMNTPFGNSITTAEHAIAMMMALAREIPQASASTHAGKWEKKKFMGTEVFGKTLGLIGCGNIGKIVASRALGLQMKVTAFDPFLSEEQAKELGVKRASFDEMLAEADFITIHTPLNDKTRGLIDAKAMAKMKQGARIINCARGGIIVEADLKDALDSGYLAGAALDVFEVEPAKENVLFGHEKVICTPHLGASTSEAQENVALQVAEQISDYLLDGAITNALNMPSVSAEDAPKLKPYLALAEQLGGFAGQVSESAIEKITIEYAGKVAGLNTKPLTSVVLASLLKPILGNVNMVSAPIFAKNKGIDISEVHTDSSHDGQTYIRVSVKSENRDRDVTGTLFVGGAPRIINVEGVPIEAALAGTMLYIRNHDKPGLIGGVGSVLGTANCNVADFRLGRKNDGSAVALVSVDDALADETLGALAELPQVIQIKQLTF
jgi:D-3-phosphoglycerate dehydrogenase